MSRSTECPTGQVRIQFCKSKICTVPPAPPPSWQCSSFTTTPWQVFGEFDTFFVIQINNNSNLIFPGFKVPSESFFSQQFQNRSYFLTHVVFKICKIESELVNIMMGHPVSAIQYRQLIRQQKLFIFQFVHHTFICSFCWEHMDKNFV